jgi:enhancing lycopene biosynthesis protein 2
MKIGVLLSGCGVNDGAEIHESVLTLLALDKLGVETVCIAPDIEQHQVVNHLNGEAMPEKRNVLIESARIARGHIEPLHKVKSTEFDGIVIPGGFGVAINFTKWGLKGPEGEIDQVVSKFIRSAVQNKVPIAALCMAPTTVAKALQGSEIKSELSVGNLDQKSPYDIKDISQGMQSVGATPKFVDKEGILVDEANAIICAPCYMMSSSISEVAVGINKAVNKLVSMALVSKKAVV